MLLVVGLFAVSTVIAVRAGGGQAAGGQLDPSFGHSGKVVTTFAKVWAMGREWRFRPTGRSSPRADRCVPLSLDVALVRYTTAGTLDATFGGGGRWLTDFVDDGETASALAIQQDGRIVIAGRAGSEVAQSFATRTRAARPELGTAGGS